MIWLSRQLKRKKIVVSVRFVSFLPSIKKSKKFVDRRENFVHVFPFAIGRKKSFDHFNVTQKFDFPPETLNFSRWNFSSKTAIFFPSSKILNAKENFLFWFSFGPPENSLRFEESLFAKEIFLDVFLRVFPTSFGRKFSFDQKRNSIRFRVFGKDKKLFLGFPSNFRGLKLLQECRAVGNFQSENDSFRFEIKIANFSPLVKFFVRNSTRKSWKTRKTRMVTFDRYGQDFDPSFFVG